MTPHMIEFVRLTSTYADIRGPVLEIGSYIEANQDHLDLRQALNVNAGYVGVDVVAGKGVDRLADLCNEVEMLALVDEIQPNAIVCLYALEHVWDIVQAAKSLAAMWNRRPESWLFVATHQNQPFHGTSNYGDYWRLTCPGFHKLISTAGVDDPKIFALDNTSNPEDILAIRQPASMSWPGAVMTTVVQEASRAWHQHS